MTERKWTKGPWVISNELGHMGCRRLYSSNYGIGEAWDINGNLENKANAHLIAAAPDLYEALEKCLGSLMSNYHDEYDGVYSDSDFDNIERPYLAALAKARGENQ